MQHRYMYTKNLAPFPIHLSIYLFFLLIPYRFVIFILLSDHKCEGWRVKGEECSRHSQGAQGKGSIGRLEHWTNHKAKVTRGSLSTGDDSNGEWMFGKAIGLSKGRNRGWISNANRSSRFGVLRKDRILSWRVECKVNVPGKGERGREIVRGKGRRVSGRLWEN